MNRRERARRATLAAVLERADAADRRALADLRVAGYRFSSLDAARQHQARLIALDRFAFDQDGDALTASLNSDRRPSP